MTRLAARPDRVGLAIGFDLSLSKVVRARTISQGRAVLRCREIATSNAKRTAAGYDALTAGGVAEVKVHGRAKVQAVFTFAILAYNLVRIPKLLGAPT